MFGYRNGLQLALLATALGVIVLGLAAVGCGPIAPGTSAPTLVPTPTVRWLGDTPSPSELDTWEAIPTATPYPPGYVRPTDLPTYTPVPPPATLLAQLLAVGHRHCRCRPSRMRSSGPPRSVVYY